MTNTDTDKLEKLMTTFKDEIKDEFRHQLSIQSENFQHKLDIVVEGHQMLSEKLDRWKTELENRIGCVEHKLDIVAARGEETATKLDAVAAKGEETAAKLDTVAAKLDTAAAKLDTVAAKLDAVADDLKAHREDTEIHKKVYKVKEE